MWVYLPDTSRPVRITPLERLSGDASNGDVARTNYSADYTPTIYATEKLGQTECHVLELTAKRKGATYQRILYWLRAEDARPVRAEFYLTSGKHIKSATFDDYAQIGGKMLLSPPHPLRRDPPQLAQLLEYSVHAARTARQALLPGPGRPLLKAGNGRAVMKRAFCCRVDISCGGMDHRRRTGRSSFRGERVQHALLDGRN